MQINYGIFKKKITRLTKQISFLSKNIFRYYRTITVNKNKNKNVFSNQYLKFRRE